MIRVSEGAVFMMNQRRFLATGMCAAAMLLTVNAQENEVAENNQGNLDVQVAPKPETKFASLVRVVNIHGLCEVNNPDVGSFKPASHNKAYPLGTTFRTGAGSSCFLVFSSEDSAELAENSEVIITGKTQDGIICESLTAKLITGTFKTSLRDNLKGSTFNINTPNADVKNMTGRGEYSLSVEDGNEVFEAATITGISSIEGPHYSIPSLQAANTVNITTSPNRSFSRLTSVSGDFTIVLPNGTEEPVNFGMSPKAIVKIWREAAPVGGRTVVSALVVSPTGMARHRFAYAEGREALITGELVQSEQDMEIPDLPVLQSDQGKGDKKEEDSTL